MSFYITFKKKTLACGSQECKLNGTPVLKLGCVIYLHSKAGSKMSVEDNQCAASVRHQVRIKLHEYCTVSSARDHHRCFYRFKCWKHIVDPQLHHVDMALY